jgi:PAS domain S-box-containing protein
MVNTEMLTWPVQRRADFTRIIVYIILATALIFIIDLLTPLGVMIWILYFIPLFLTVYLSWKYAPLVLTGVFILLMAVSLFVSPRDISLGYALLNRAFFALILVIASVFIEEYVANVGELARSEERYRHLIEWLPEGIIVCRAGAIAFINPAGARLLGAGSGEDLAGRTIADMIDPAFRTEFQERVAQAGLGARIDLENVRIIRQNHSPVTVGMSLGAMVWDKETAVQIVIRNSL